MGILTDAFIASASELDALRPGAGGPAALFPTVQAKRMDPVKLASLEALLAPPARDWDEDGMLMREWEEQWIYRLKSSLAHGLVALPADEIARVAREWAATEEWRLDGVDPANDASVADLAALIAGLRQLAWQARQDAKDLYLWISL